MPGLLPTPLLTSGGGVTAPTFTNLTSGATSGATSGVTASVSPAGNQLILVTVHAYLSSGSLQPATPSVTGNGITYTLVQAQNTDDAGTDRGTIFVFRGMASSPTAGAVTISFGAVSQTRIFWAVDQSDVNVNTSGTNGSGAVVQSTGVTLAAAGTSASVNYAAAMRPGSSGFSAWGHQVQEGKTPRAGWTEVADNSSLTLAPLETQYIAGTDTAGSVTWVTSSRGGGVVLEIAAPPVLLAAYGFDEASGTILDQSGNGRDVTFGGSFTRVSGHTGTALSQSTTAADSNGPTLTGMQTAAYTIEGWVNRSTNSIDGWMMEYKQAGSGDRGILMTGGNIQSRCKNVAGSALTVQTTQPTAGTPYHVAATNDGNTLRLFINGSEIGTGTAFTGGVRTNSTSSSLFDTLGSETYLDDVRYYDGALSAAQITTDMGTPVTGSGTTGTAAVTQASDTSTASGQLGYSGTSATSQAANTSTATGTVVNPVTGTAAPIQASQTATASGQLGYSGTSTANQANQTASASGQLGYSGTSARTQANQTSTATGQLGYSGSAAAAQAANTSTASGTFTGTGISGNAAVTQAANTSTASGQLGYSGTSTQTQANQTSTASGQLGYTGSSATSQAAQTSTASGTFTSAGSFTGTAAVTQASQTGSATGQLGYSGTASRTQANNTSAASGNVVNPVTGTASPVQASQFSTASGILRYIGTTAVVQASNTSSATGTVSGPVSGTAAVVQAGQISTAAGQFTPLVSFGTATSAVGAAPTTTAGVMTVATASRASMTTPNASGG